MKKVGLIYIGFCLFVLTCIGCSNDDSNNDKESNPKMELQEQNIQKKWIAAHFSFTEQGHSERDAKLDIQKSFYVVEFLSDGKFKGVNKYDNSSYQGDYTFDKGILQIVLQDKDTYQFQVKDLRKKSMNLVVVGGKLVDSVEMIVE